MLRKHIKIHPFRECVECILKYVKAWCNELAKMILGYGTFDEKERGSWNVLMHSCLDNLSVILLTQYDIIWYQNIYN